jgi:hypothetical protein
MYIQFKQPLENLNLLDTCFTVAMPRIQRDIGQMELSEAANFGTNYLKPMPRTMGEVHFF